MNSCPLPHPALLLIFCSCCLLPSLAASEPSPCSASAALLAVPARYDNGIIQVVGQSGAPWPTKWIIYARDADGGGTTMQLTFEDGQIIHEQVSLRPSAMFQESAYILQEPLSVDADRAFTIAQKTAQTHGQSMVAANYELVRQGPDEAPRWIVQCLNEKGTVLGTVQILCTDGAVLSSTGFH